MKKIISLILIVSTISMTLIGCTAKNKSNEEDKDVKIAVITEESNKENYSSYKSAIYISNMYKQKNKNGLNNDKVEHIIIPKEIEKNKDDLSKFMEKIINDKELQGVVFVSVDQNLLKYAKEIKNKRDDITTFGVDIKANEEELNTYLDISYISDNVLQGENTVQLAKEMGSEAFILYYSEKDLIDNKSLIKKINSIEEECKQQNLVLEKVKVKDINYKEDEYDVKKFISENINNQIYKYGEDINLFGTNKTIDDVILKRGIKSKVIISEISNGCMVDNMKDLYRMNRRTKENGDYKGYTKYITDGSLKYEMNGRLGGIIMPNEIFTVYAAVDTAIAIAEDGGDVKKAYNSYFIEKNIYEKEGITASFESINNKYPSIKVVSVDQIIY